jgi:hypothetical protein
MSLCNITPIRMQEMKPIVIVQSDHESSLVLSRNLPGIGQVKSVVRGE